MNYGGSPLNVQHVRFYLSARVKHKTRKRNKQQQVFKHVARKDEEDEILYSSGGASTRAAKAPVIFSPATSVIYRSRPSLSSR